MQKLKPGELAPQTGTYNACDNSGKTMYTVDIQEGEHLPPTPANSENWYFVLSSNSNN